MKKHLVFILIALLTLLSCSAKDKPKITKVIITQNFHDTFWNKDLSVEIYNSGTEEIEELINKISKAKTISINSAIKEVLEEGEFNINFYSNENIILDYTVWNKQNANDNLSGKFKKLEIIELIPNMIHPSHKVGPVREDLFIGLSEEVLVKTFGENFIESEPYIYSKEVYPIYEDEPDYVKYLTRDDFGKNIKTITWKSDDKTIRIWFIKDKDMWKSFSSLEYIRGVQF